MQKNVLLKVLALIVMFSLVDAASAQRRGGIPPGLSEKLGRQLEQDWQDRPEWADMAIEILSGPLDSLKQGDGWFKGSQVRYDWEWVLKTHDDDFDQKIRPDEAGSIKKNHFAAIDRDRSGFLSKEDFDWSAGSPVFEKNDPATDIFFRLDTDSNGRVTRQELTRLFDERANDVDFLTTEDLRDGLGLRAKKEELRENGRKPQGSPPQFVRLQMLNQLMNREWGSLNDGPKLNDDAPDLDLPVMKLKEDKLTFGLSGERVKLKDHVGKRPVVLVFGSFT